MSGLVPIRRHGRETLRRKILATVVLLATIPAFLALFAASFISFASLRQTVRSQGRDEATALSQDIDKRLSQLNLSLREALVEPGLQAAIIEGATESDPIRSFSAELPITMGDLSVYFSDAQGAYIGQLLKGAVDRGGAPQAELADVLRSSAAHLPVDLPERTPVLVERRSATGEVQLWMLARIGAGTTSPAIHVHVLLPLERIFSLVEQPPGTAMRRPLIVASRALGIVRAPAYAGGVEAAIAGEGSDFYTEAYGNISAGPRRDEGLEYAYARILTATSLSAGASTPVSWVVLTPVDLRETTASLFHSFWLMAIFGIALAMAVAVFGFWASGRIVAPVIELTRGVERLASGDNEFRVRIKTNDELEDLAASMNQMAETLNESWKRLADKLLQVDEQARRLALIHRISQSTNRSLEPGEMLPMFIAEVRDLIPVDRLSIGLISEDGVTAELIHVFPEGRDHQPKGARIAFANTPYGDAISTASVVVEQFDDARAEARAQALEPSGSRLLCVIPLNTAGGPIGFLSLADSQRHSFTPNELEILTQVSDGVALAIEHGRLYMRIRSFAADLELRVEERTRDLREAQEQLVRSERFAATGKIAADLAHEINNPLSIIKNYLAILSSQTLRQRAPSPVDLDAIRDGVHVIQEEIDRIARIVSQLRQLNSPQKPVLKRVAINDEVASLAGLFRATIAKQSLTLEVVLDPELGEVRIWADHLRQILLNLLTNAADATPPGGTITIRTQLDRRSAANFLVRVEDTGTGIPRENLTRIFDPFFTTKKEGKGTGLGLSVSYSLAQRMGGTLTATSEVGRGTAMTITLPLVPPEEPVKPRDENESDSSGVVHRRGGKIILG